MHLAVVRLQAFVLAEGLLSFLITKTLPNPAANAEFHIK